MICNLLTFIYSHNNYHKKTNGKNQFTFIHPLILF